MPERSQDTADAACVKQKAQQTLHCKCEQQQVFETTAMIDGYTPGALVAAGEEQTNSDWATSG